MKAHSRPLLFLLLALVLLFAQQGAAVHALSHLSDPLPRHSQQDKHFPHSSACEKCVVYAGIGSALSADELNLPPAVQAVAPLECEPNGRRPQSVRYYRSRAPPSLV